jgi:hypothetical protein
VDPKLHNKVLGILYAIYGGLICLAGVGLSVFALIIYAIAASDGNTKLSGTVFQVVTGTILLIVGLIPLTVGFGVMRGRRWARIASIVLSFFLMISIPFGIAISVYTWVFMFSESAKQFYEQA